MDEEQVEKLRIIAVEKYGQFLLIQQIAYRRGDPAEKSSKQQLEEAESALKEAHQKWHTAAVQLRIEALKARAQKK